MESSTTGQLERKNNMRFLCALLLLIAAPLQAEEKITKKDSKEILSYLASDELGGRGIGQEGNRIAARFIAKKFKEYGLRPLYIPVYIHFALFLMSS